MLRRLALLTTLLLFSLGAQAAVSFVAFSTAHSASGTTQTPAEPTGTAENDLVLLFCTHLEQDGNWLATGFTELDEQLGAASHESSLHWVVRGGSAPSYTCNYSGGTAGRIRATAVTFRGMCVSDPFRVTYSSGSHYASHLNDGALTAAEDIGVVDSGDWVVIFTSIFEDGVFTAGAPTSYTMRVDEAGGDRTAQIASISIDSTRTENPGAWTHSGVTGTADSIDYSVAIRLTCPSSGNLLRIRRT